MSTTLSPDVTLPKETLPHIIRRALTDPRPEALVERVNGAWTPVSSQTVLERALNVACAIRASGVQQGDRDRREQRTVPKHSEGVPEIGQKRSHHRVGMQAAGHA